MIYIAKPVDERTEGRWSWHLLWAWTPTWWPESALTLCGRHLQRVIEHPGLPSGRTCETCLRIAPR